MKLLQLVIFLEKAEIDSLRIINKTFYEIRDLVKAEIKGFAINGKLNIHSDIKTNFRFGNIEDCDSYMKSQEEKYDDFEKIVFDRDLYC